MVTEAQRDSMRVIELWRYPVKSLQGERLESVSVNRSGFEGDRQFAITLASFNYAPTGPVSGTVKSVGSVTLNKEGTELTGRFRIQSFDLTGALLTSFTASVHGRRIQVEQFP